MLEPTAIHSYEPPLYRVQPPSPSEGPPPSLPFSCVVLEHADASGGPSPAQLHALRQLGCRLILAQFEHPQPSSPRGIRTAPLNKEWFDAVFDKVLTLSNEPRKCGLVLERFLSDNAVPPEKALCFAVSDAGAEAFSSVDAGLILAPSYDKVCCWEDDADGKTRLRMPGADVATHESPSARQLAWLHTVFTQKLWCVCLWLLPPPGELKGQVSLPGTKPSALERAQITRVSSPTMSVLGHPAWSWQERDEESSEPTCKLLVGKKMVTCPDWTPLEPRVRRAGGGPVQEIVNFPKVALYCHSLDVGVAEVNHALESLNNDGLRIKVSSRRLVSLARPGHAATEMSLMILESSSKAPPELCVRSSLRVDQVPPGFTIREGSARADEDLATLTCDLVNNMGETLTLRAFHRLTRDDGRGDEQLKLGATDGLRGRVQVASKPWGAVRKGTVALDLIFSNPRRGSRYTIEKVVTIQQGQSQDEDRGPQRMMRTPSGPRMDIQSFSSHDWGAAPPTLPEVEEEHRSAWCTEWDRADMEFVGFRKSARFQRAVRLFRFHQVSLGHPTGSAKKEAQVPEPVRQLFQAAYDDLISPGEGEDQGSRPSSLITSRITVQDPRTPPVIRIEPNVPPACERLQFNSALGGRWHRFTLTPGTVQILVQGPVMLKPSAQLYGDTVSEPPKFIIPAQESEAGVEVRALPWHEVQVRHALTELGRPDGSAGGFYSLMRRTRFTRVEVLRRLYAEGDDAYNDETLTQPLRSALARLESVPRPPGWREGDNENLHMLEADATTRVRVVLEYEKTELERDITFLEGHFTRHEGQLGGEDLMVETMTVRDAKTRCPTIAGCRGFTFQSDVLDGLVEVHFRSSADDKQGGPHQGWHYFVWEDGETALGNLLSEQHDKRFRCLSGKHPVWVEPEIPSFEQLVDRTVEVLRKTSRPLEDDVIQEQTVAYRPFRNLVTDRDGTTNNYCDRYSSCVQSAYNAAWLSHFAKHCAHNAVFITAAPLGGRSSAEGLMDLSVAPRSDFTYTGSKGREYFDPASQRVLEAEELPQEQRELVDELHRRILALGQLPGNAKFLGIGSGLQRKFGEITMARNDPAGTVADPESRRFMGEVRRVKEELDPDGTLLDMHDTGTDIEIFPRIVGGNPSFDKGMGVLCLDEKLKLNCAEGPNVVCGDTGSDIPMVVSVLRLMCGDKLVDMWQDRIRRQEDPDSFSEPEEEAPPQDETEEEMEQRLREESERRAREEEEEQEAREAGAKLAVIFVIDPRQHDKSPKLCELLRRWCDLSGANLMIVPSPDVLVASLAKFANQVAGRTVTEKALLYNAPLVGPCGSPARSVSHDSSRNGPFDNLPSLPVIAPAAGAALEGDPSSSSTPRLPDKRDSSSSAFGFSVAAGPPPPPPSPMMHEPQPLEAALSALPPRSPSSGGANGQDVGGRDGPPLDSPQSWAKAHWTKV